MKLIFIFTLIFSSTLHASDWQTQILNDARTLYTSQSINEFKKPFVIDIENNELLAASASHNAHNLRVVVNSALLKSPKLTKDSLRMIVCHEIGHLFGGAPRKNLPPEWEGPIGVNGLSLMSSEGQADYYASLICFKKMLKLETKETKNELDLTRVGPVLRNKCEATAGLKGRDLEVCLRSALAGLDFLNVTHDFDISCEVEDEGVAESMMRDFYPDRQCRLDTMINGSLCTQSATPLLMDDSDEAKNSCAKEYAKRPICWFP